MYMKIVIFSNFSKDNKVARVRVHYPSTLTLVVLDVLERLVHQAALTAVITVVPATVHQVLFAQRHEITGLTIMLSLQRSRLQNPTNNGINKTSVYEFRNGPTSTFSYSFHWKIVARYFVININSTTNKNKPHPGLHVLLVLDCIYSSVRNRVALSNHQRVTGINKSYQQRKVQTSLTTVHTGLVWLHWLGGTLDGTWLWLHNAVLPVVDY